MILTIVHPFLKATSRVGRALTDWANHQTHRLAAEKWLPVTGTLPTSAHPEDAGLDPYAADTIYLQPDCRCLVPTGTHVIIPKGYVGLICPRSGRATKKGITVLNAPGTNAGLWPPKIWIKTTM